MKTSHYLLPMLLAAASVAQADTLAQWNFNSTPPDGSTSTGTLTPNIGSGTATGVGGVNFLSYFGGSGTDTSLPGNNNSGWSLVTFPAASVGNKTAGAQFNASTLGYTGISVTWDQRASATASKFSRFQYTTDGSSWVDSTQFAVAVPTSFESRSVDLSAITAVANNPNFGFRIVAEFNPTNNTSYVGASGTYGPSGTWRFDMVTVEGTTTQVPEPGVLLTNGLVLVGGVGALWSYRRRKAK